MDVAAAGEDPARSRQRVKLEAQRLCATGEGVRWRLPARATLVGDVPADRVPGPADSPTRNTRRRFVLENMTAQPNACPPARRPCGVLSASRAAAPRSAISADRLCGSPRN